MPERKSKLNEPLVVQFSGGRTSGMMLWMLRNYWGDPNFYTLFQNTGREMEETLKFVRDVEVNWNVPIVWLEYAVDQSAPILVEGKRPKVGNHSFRVTNFEECSRHGEPFEMLIDNLNAFRAEKGEGPILPNVIARYCSAQLKRRVCEAYINSLGIAEYTTAIGYRADEPGRASRSRLAEPNKSFLFPLVTAGYTLSDVLNFWRDQPFDLELKSDPQLGTYQGNCDFCFLKKQEKLSRLANEQPERLAWWVEQERKTGANFRRGRVTFTAMQEVRKDRKPLEVVQCEDDLTECNCTD